MRRRNTCVFAVASPMTSALAMSPLDLPIATRGKHLLLSGRENGQTDGGFAGDVATKRIDQPLSHVGRRQRLACSMGCVSVPS